MSALPNGTALRRGSDAIPTKGSQILVSPLADASDVATLHDALTSLYGRETDLTTRLDALVSSQTDLNRDLGRLDLLRAGLSAQIVATRSVGNDVLSSAANTAGDLSSKVKWLDLEKIRVDDTLGVVEQVAELKACINGVVGSMGAPQDWEAAAGYLARSSNIPEDIIKGAFAASIVPSVEVPDAPWVTLENAKESLCALFLREFEKAAADADGVKITRFFKLFPLIGRADTGLDVYGRYVCQGVAGMARSALKEGAGGQTRQNGFFYANALISLFENIARIVDSHGGLVERHYGAGKMVRVIERIQMEADVQGGIIIDTWTDERRIERTMTDVKSYPFSFLVQSFLPQPSRAGTPRINSPSVGGVASSRQSEDEGVDMKEVDGRLSEIAVMLGRWSFYTRFVSAKCMDPNQPDSPLVLADAMTKSNLYKKIWSKLTMPYNTMMTFFFRRSIEKAFQLDEYPSGLTLNLNRQVEGNTPYIISAVDDAMYIVNAVIEKSVSTAQRTILSSTISSVDRVLSGDFIGMIQRKMRDESYPKPTVQGGFPPEDKIIQFIVLINSLEMANQYLSRIISTRIIAPPSDSNGAQPTEELRRLFCFEKDASSVAIELHALQSKFVSKSTELLNEGVHRLFIEVVRTRLRLILNDTFRDADYSWTEEEVLEYAQQNGEEEGDILEMVTRRFESGWDRLMKPIARLMTPTTFSSLLDQTASYLSKILEKRILSSSGKTSAYGAIRIERDFTGIVDAVARGDYRVREVFNKVTQVMMVANMEDEEWDEIIALGDDDGIEWVITDEERKKARGLVKQ